MVYKKPRKTTRGTIPKHKYVEACKRVIQGGESLRKVARDYGMSHVTLAKRIKRFKETGFVGEGYRSHNQILNAKQEEELVSFYTSCKLSGLKIISLRKLAYEFIKGLDIIIPNVWLQLGMASPDWFKAFLGRHVTISEKLKPEPNMRSIEETYRDCMEVLSRWEFKSKIIVDNNVDNLESITSMDIDIEPKAGCSHFPDNFNRDSTFVVKTTPSSEDIFIKSEYRSSTSPNVDGIDCCILCNVEYFDKEELSQCTDCYKWAHNTCIQKGRRNPTEFQIVALPKRIGIRSFSFDSEE